MRKGTDSDHVKALCHAEIVVITESLRSVCLSPPQQAFCSLSSPFSFQFPTTSLWSSKCLWAGSRFLSKRHLIWMEIFGRTLKVIVLSGPLVTSPCYIILPHLGPSLHGLSRRISYQRREKFDFSSEFIALSTYISHSNPGKVVFLFQQRLTS